MAVKGKTKGEILAAFQRRLQHDQQQEFAAALREIDAIAALRLKDILQ
jgi:urate oxidase